MDRINKEKYIAERESISKSICELPEFKRRCKFDERYPISGGLGNLTWVHIGWWTVINYWKSWACLSLWQEINRFRDGKRKLDRLVIKLLLNLWLAPKTTKLKVSVSTVTPWKLKTSPIYIPQSHVWFVAVNLCFVSTLKLDLCT